MNKLISIFILLFITGLVVNPIVIADTYPTEADYRYLKGCFGEERPTHDHAGIDIVGKEVGDINGKPAYAFREGIVTFADWENGYGKTVDIKHSDGTKTRYAHLETINEKIKEAYENYIKSRIEEDTKRKEEK